MTTAPHTLESLNATQAAWMALRSTDPKPQIDAVIAAMERQPKNHLVLSLDGTMANLYWCGPVWAESRPVAEAIDYAKEIGIQTEWAWRTDGQWVAVPHPVRTIFYGRHRTRAKANAHVLQIIGGGIIQKQGRDWIVFGINRA